MKFWKGALSLSALAILFVPIALTEGRSAPDHPSLASSPDPAGVTGTYDQNNAFDLSSPFFQSLGTNGRSCATCHQPSDAMGLSAAHTQARFDSSQGLEPLFRTVDGSNCDHTIDTSTLQGRASAYSLLRTRAIFRIALAVPATRDYEVVGVSNPYGCNETDTISTYRRPLLGANLRFLSAVMWDGRESSAQTGTIPINGTNYPDALLSDLRHQALDATNGHAQANVAITPAQQQAIVDVETSLFTAQAEDKGAGTLSAQGANGGPEPLSNVPFYIGKNDPVGFDPANPTPLSFNTKIFDLFDAWEAVGNPHRQAIARGQKLFNTRTFTITNVAGLNGTTFSNGVTGPQSIQSTCGICHDTPNVGDHSVAAPLNIGVADPPGGNNVLDTSYLPVITICQKPALTTCVRTTDPGRALISGNFADVGKFKGPTLRGLSARAPYFHNGSALTLEDVVNFYDSRFQIGFTAQEKSDLAAFLSSL